MTASRRTNGRYAKSWERFIPVLILIAFLLTGAYFWLQGDSQEPLFIQPEQVRAIEPQMASLGTLPEPTPAGTEKQQIMHYIVEKFGERANDAIAMLSTCENHKLDPKAVNRGNTNGTCDVGVFQINTTCDSPEYYKLMDWKYNIDRAYEKYSSKKNTFYYWTCAYVVKDYSYLDAIRGVKRNK